MNDDLKGKLDLLDIPDASITLESKIIQAARITQKKEVFVYPTMSSLKDFFSTFLKPMALVACLAIFVTLISFKDNFDPIHNSVTAKTNHSHISIDDNFLDDFALFDEDEFLFDADWMI